MHSAQRKSSGQSQRQSSLRSTRSATAAGTSMRQSDVSTEQQGTAQPHDDSQRHVPVMTSKWWHVHLFRGMVNDVKRRAPYYWSDWTDAWDYRVVPATIYMYFAKYVGPVLISRHNLFDKVFQ